MEDDPIIKDSMDDIGTLLVGTFGKLLAPMLVVAHTVNNSEKFTKNIALYIKMEKEQGAAKNNNNNSNNKATTTKILKGDDENPEMAESGKRLVEFNKKKREQLKQQQESDKRSYSSTGIGIGVTISLIIGAIVSYNYTGKT